MLKIAAVFMCSILVLLSILMGIPGETFSDISLKLSAETAATEEYVMNKWCEVILTAQTQNASDAFDVIVSATFTGPGGQTYEIPGRHRTGNQWAVRFLPPAIGQWSYETFSRTHPQDAGLHGVKGTVTKSAETKQPTVYLATDYVDKNSVDVTADMRRLFQEASRHANTTGNPVEVRLESGVNYRMNSQGSETAPIIINSVKNMFINGQGATLTGLNLQSGILQIAECENIIVKDIFFDYDPLPYSYGTVTHIDGNIFHFKIDEGFIEFDYPAYTFAVTRTGTWGVKLSYENGVKIYGQTVAGSTTFLPLGNREWKLDTSTMPLGTMGSLGVKVNDKFIILCRNYSQAVSVISTKNIVLENLVIYSSPGIAFYPAMVEDFVIRDSHVRVKDDRPISTNADGINMRSSRGNVLIEGCTFEGMMDDSINIHTRPLSVIRRISDNQYELSKHVNSVRKGDRLQAIEQGTGRIIDIVTVTDVRIDSWNYIVTFDRNIELTVGTHFNNADNLFNLDESASALVIKDCTLNAYRGRGILLSCHNGLLYNNAFRMQGGPCISLIFDTQTWGQGPISRNIVIRNNTFQRVRSAVYPINTTAIPGAEKISTSIYENIYILNNSFIGYGISATGVINMSNAVAETLTIEGNEFMMLPPVTITPSPDLSSSSFPPSATVTMSVPSPGESQEERSEEHSGGNPGNSSEGFESILLSGDTSLSGSDTADPKSNQSLEPEDIRFSEEDSEKEDSWSTLLPVLVIFTLITALAGGAWALKMKNRS
jgi:hypothetical protein